MEPATIVQFAEGARLLARAAHRRGLVAPTFRSPPRLPVDRTIRRARTRPAVAVRFRGRPWVAVAADMIEGVIVANRLTGVAALQTRGVLWAALGFETTRAEDAVPAA